MHTFAAQDDIAVSCVGTSLVVEMSYIGQCLSNLAAKVIVLRPPTYV